MEKESAVLKNLKERFPGLAIENAKVSIRRIYLEVPGEMFMDILQYAAELGFSHLCTITGLDTGDWFEFIYHVSNNEGIVINFKRKTSRDNPVIESVLPIHNGAVFYEREIEGILGVKVEGLPEGRRYPLPDNWPEGQYPLRKDWMPGNTENQ